MDADTLKTMLSHHARKRMKERGITEEEVIKLIRKPYRLSYMLDDKVRLVNKEETLSVILSSDFSKIITLYKRNLNKYKQLLINKKKKRHNGKIRKRFQEQ